MAERTEEQKDVRDFDVFLSHAGVDKTWVTTLAENLVRLGLRPFLDCWQIAPGDVLVHELDHGLRTSRCGVLVVSPEALARPWVQQEYAAMVTAAVEHGRPLIPVIYRDAEMPPLLRNFLWLDFRDLDGERYLARVSELAAALEGKPKGPPANLGSELQLPPGSGMRAAGPIRRRLRFDVEEATLLGGDEVVRAAFRGADHRVHDRLWRLSRAFRRRPEPLRKEGGAGVGTSSISRAQVEVGTALASAFLPDAVGDALRADLRRAEASGSSLELGLEATGPLADLPWETLCLPPVDAPVESEGAGEPLALHPRVHLYRTVAGEGAVTEWQIPGPLRILVAIGSPDAQNARGELLDMEAELQSILDAVEPARRQGKAYVRVLERGTVKSIRQALEQERFHVLHISSHARPGVLILEDEEGGEDRVSAERLWKEALPADRGVPLVVLAGCATALDVALGVALDAAAEANAPSSADAAAENENDEAADESSDGPAAESSNEKASEPLAAPETGLARQLLGHGVPAVLAMQRSVGDRYATKLGAALYAQLALSASPEPLRAVAAARSSVEATRADDPRPEELAEWSTPVLFLRTGGEAMSAAPRLYDPGASFEKIEPPAEPSFRVGIVRRRVGKFVGRRSDLRRLLARLRAKEGGGAVIRGIGGLGKSTLAAEVAAALAGTGWIVASVFGETHPDDLLGAIGKTLFSIAIANRLDEKHPFRQLKQVLDRRDVEPAERLGVLQQNLFNQLPVLVLLDNFEDNLELPGDEKVEFRSTQLKEFLAAWVAGPGLSRLLITSRYPVPLRRLHDHALSPLSPAETRKLIWRLPGLDALEPAEKQRAYVDVGGHPRALEYLDALLRGGEARFGDVAEHLERVLRERKGVTDPGAWVQEHGTDFDQALAATVTLATSDVLLERLLQGFADRPLAWPLLLGASVYRQPVETAALVWQVAEQVPDLPEKGADAFPEVAVPPAFEAALRALERGGLVASLEDGETRRHVVHRWTADALARLSSPEERQEAHRRAARYWRWRVRIVSRSLEEALEARHHHHEAGELDEAVEVSGSVCLQLQTWGAYAREEQLLRETLAWLPKRSLAAAQFTGQLGNLAHLRGSYDEALDWHRKALQLLEEFGDRRGMATAYHQLGIIEQHRGSYDGALDWYRRSLAIEEELGDRAGMAGSYHQLGIIESLRGSYDEALDWYRRSLAIKEELSDRAGMATSYHQLGIIEQHRGSYDEALDWYRRSLAILEELGDRAGMAKSYHHLGMIEQYRGSYDEALAWYRHSLELAEGLGDRAGLADSYGQLSIFFTKQADPEQALPWGLRGLALYLELQSPNMAILLRSMLKQRQMLGDERFRGIASEHMDAESVSRVLAMLDQFEEANAGTEDAGDTTAAPG